MPNHIDSILDIEGPVLEIEKLIKKVQGKNHGGHCCSIFTCHKIIPMPKEINNPKKDLWYNWSVNNWGSKWDVYETRLIKNLPSVAVDAIKILDSTKAVTKTKIRYQWLSAWTPISPVVKKLSEMFPTLEFTFAYIDDGNGFADIVEYKKGKATLTHAGAFGAVGRKMRNPPKCLKGIEPEYQQKD